MKELDSTALAAAPPTRKMSRWESEQELNARSSLLDTETDIGFRETVRIIARGSGYMRYFAGRFIIKMCMTWVARAVPLFILPWPAKILIDHVVLGRPIEEAEGYPAFVWPIIESLYGSSPMDILFWLAVFSVSLMLLIGAYHPSVKDEVEVEMMEGHDQATQNENWMHSAHSNLGALYGYIEFKINTRLTQALNHTLRSELFSRIASLSMTRLEDQRIGDSIYRILYNTPQVNQIFYYVVQTPLVTSTLYIAAAWVMLSAYPNVSEIVWFSVGILPIWVFVSVFFSRVVRRRGQASRAAGSITTSTIEAGMDTILSVQILCVNRKDNESFAGARG